MMYVELMKNFHLSDSSELMAVRLISASWASDSKNVWFLLSRHDVDVRRVHEKFSLADSSELMAVRLISASWAEKRLIPLSRHDVRRAMKNFHLADSSELLAVRLILASWAQKRLIPTF